MKLTFKLIAAAVALVAASGANAALTAYTSGNGSIALYAVNTETGGYYIRDTGLLLNDFLPSSVTTAPNDGGVTGTRTPTTGLTLNSTTNANFADSSFATWFAGQNAEATFWALVGGDSLQSASPAGAVRVLTTGVSGTTFTDGQVTNAINGSNLGTLTGLFGAATLSRTANSGAPGGLATGENGGLGVETMTAVGSSASLFYIARTSLTSPAFTTANITEYGNAAGSAIVTLLADGQLSYVLGAESVSAVPVPAAVWLLGSGLLGAGGFIRRRKAAAQA